MSLSARLVVRGQGRLRSGSSPAPVPCAGAALRTAVWVVVLSMVVGCGRADDARKAVESAASSVSDKLHSVTTAGPDLVLDRMLTCARAGDWEGYVAYYGESHKFRTDRDRVELAYRFRSEWGGRVLAKLERADTVEPVIEGDRAVFRDGTGEVLVLYRGEDGRWGFHL